MAIGSCLIRLLSNMFSLLNIRIGFYLAFRQIRRSSLWTTGLIVFVMLLTFLNLVGVTGILVGLIQGIGRGYKEQYTGDVFISSLETQNYIKNSPQLISFIKTLPQVAVIDPRYVAGATFEANYKSITDPNQKTNSTGAQVVGIDTTSENALSGISKYVIEGSYLAANDYDQILIGSELLDQYAFGGPGQRAGVQTLKNVMAGSMVRMTINGVQREVRVKGIVKSTGGNISQRVFIPSAELLALTKVNDYSVEEIAIRLKPGEDSAAFKKLLVNSGVAKSAKIQTSTEAIPSGVAQITATFAAIGNVVSSIGLVVASITIFIVIFVNALTRRKFIGILKGIGIAGEAIEISYIFQSLFYAISGSGIGLLLLYGVVLPLNTAHPIQLPLGGVIIYAPVAGTLLRVGLLIFATMIAGYIPARMIVKRNTLDSILGRN
jgi:ABC-type lipoprotein release transport system permease subunit